jgi:hypothetical protein
MRWITLVALFVLGAGVYAASTAATGKPRYTCPQSFTRVTLAEALALPRTQAAINDGVATEAEILADYEARDANDNDHICFQLPPGFEASSTSPFSQYFYNFNDDKASVPEA